MPRAIITICRIALRFCPKWLGQRRVIESLADLLFERFEDLGAISDLEEALVLRRKALERRLQDDPLRSRSLEIIAHYLHTRFDKLGTLPDLDEALALRRNALELHPQGHPCRGRSLCNVARSLYSRFLQLRTLSDLEEAITLQRSALELHPQGHPDHADSLSGLSRRLYARFSSLGLSSDLDEALALGRRVLELRPHGHPRRATSLSSVASSLHSRFNLRGVLSDLDEALALERSALELRPQGHPDRAISLSDIATFLYTRFTQLGMLPDLDEALVLHRDALELRPEGHPDRDISLSGIAFCYSSRFDFSGILSDLTEALALQRRALQLLPEGHPDRAISLGHLASSLQARFMQLGTLSDLDEALALERSALELRPQGHPDHTRSLRKIATCHRARFDQSRMLSDLDEAISFERSAFHLLPKGHPDQTRSLCDIAGLLYTRFTQLGALSDLDEALSLEQNALELDSEQHLDRPILLSNTANYHYARFTRLRMLYDLEEAIYFERNALELRSEGHPDRALSLCTIALYLHARFIQLGILADLDEALDHGHHALELRPQGHPCRATSLCNLARYLHARFEYSHDINDLQESFGLYSQLSDILQIASSSDLKCAKEWIHAAEEYDHSTAILAYQTFLHLIVHHIVILPLLPEHLASLKQLINSVPLNVFSASVCSGDPTNAIELLEQARGVFWTQLNRLRSLDEMIASGDTGTRLADELTQLASLIRSAFDAPPNSRTQHDRLCHLNILLQATIAEIRKLPGLSRFLQPPLFSDLRVAATNGPIIIVNASQYTCDAVVLFLDKDPIHIALRITKSRVSELSSELRSLSSCTKFRDATRDLVLLLQELWDVVVSPITKILQESCPPQSRIWWCPTAEFSLLPLHAAGPYRMGQLNLSDLYISSYTATLTALISARQKRPSNPSIDQHRLLIVGQTQSPDQNKLASVNNELSCISRHIESVATVTCVQDQEVNIAKVAEELERNQFVHFACHGVPDWEHPFESGFSMGDGLLTVANMMRHGSQDAQFAYLSACHTPVENEESPDEIINLAAAMQFSGFRSVIGTMWAVDDVHATEIASRVYGYMVDESGRLDHTRAALALHRTMNFQQGDIPFDQRIAYVHVGV